MDEETIPTNPVPAEPAVAGPRIFKIGTVKIAEDDSTAGMSNEQVRERLKLHYPEIANSTMRERDDNGTRVVEFLAQPGHKG